MKHSPKRWEDAWRDESWEAIRYKVHVKREDGQQGTEIGSFLSDAEDGTEDAYSDRGRAALAAQAPAMARLLLDLEWKGNTENIRSQYLPLCVVCRGSRGHEGHTKDCALVAVLRDAGVLETP